MSVVEPCREDGFESTAVAVDVAVELVGGNSASKLVLERELEEAKIVL